MSEIFNKKYLKNEKIISQNFLVIKFNVSRIVVVNALNDLIKSGIIYSVPKKGYFVSEYFSNIIKPLEIEYNIDKTIKKAIIDVVIPEWFQEDNILLSKAIRNYSFQYYYQNNLIISSEIYLSGNLEKNYLIDRNFIDILMSENVKLKSILNKYFFVAGNIINIKIYYGHEEIIAVSRSKIGLKYFNLVKEEFNIK